MNRRDLLKRTGVGIAATSTAGVAAADVSTDACGDCFTEECHCDGEWYDCGIVGTDCCDGEIVCECEPKCVAGCPC